MHLPPALLSKNADARNDAGVSEGHRNLDFLWLELTNRCNLKCVHCYTESSPQSKDRDLLMADDYESVMNQAYALGCRRMQFIGGEPQLNRDFMRLLAAAQAIGFDFIEVFTNLTHLSADTIRFAANHGVHFATSVYSYDPIVHDAVTTVRSSHARTVRNLQSLIDHGIETRAAIIVIDQDHAMVESTTEFLRELGVGSVRSSHVREFGRGEAIVGQQAHMSALCGHCLGWKALRCA